MRDHNETAEGTPLLKDTVALSGIVLLGLLWADSRGHWGLMGALIAAAALIKLWLIGLLLYLLLRRKWSAFLWSAGGFGAALVLSFGLVGFSQMGAFLRVLQESKAAQEGQEFQSSIAGFANVSLHPNLFVTPFSSNAGICLAFIALGTASILAGFRFLWRRLEVPTPLEARLAFGVTLASVLLLLPTYENGYFVYCFPLLWALLASPDAADQRQERFAPAWIMLVGGVIIYLIFSRPWPFLTPFAPSYQHGLKSLLVSMKFFGTVSLWGLGLYVLHGIQSVPAAASARVQVQS